MHRSRAHSGVFAPLLLAMLLGIAALAPQSARAVDPTPNPFLDAAADAGLPCDDLGDSSWHCEEPSNSVDDRSFFATVDDDGEFGFYLTVYRGSQAPAPAEPDVLALMDRFIVLALGDDAEARAWVVEMHESRSELASFEREGWTLDWYADWEGNVAGVEAGVQLLFNFNPAWEGSSDPDTGAANPSPVPASGWSPRGSSSYEGSWTLTAYATDGEGFEPEYAVGDSRPGTIELTCTGESDEDGCGFVATIDGGQFWQVATLEPDATGELRSVTDTELDNCEDGQIHRRIITARHGAESATAVVEDLTIPRTCTWDNSTLYTEDLTWTFEGALVDYVPAEPPAGAGPSAGAAPSASAAPSDAPAPAAPAGGGAPAGGHEFASSVAAPAEISTDPIVVLQSAALAALLVFLMPFPSQLFNSTLETHEDEVRRWFRLDRVGAAVGRIGALWASWPGVALFTLLAALLYGFLDPGFGLDVGSLATFLGMLVGIVLVTAAFAIPLVLAHRRHGERPSLKVVPVSLAIGVVCVLLSRLTDFQPGYLYGLLIGLAFARELSAAEEGRATALGAGLMLGVALVAWLGLGALPEGDGFGLVVGRTGLAALMVAGLEGVVFGLLPMRFLPGEALYRWNQVLWAGLLLVGAFAFFHILINPASGYLSDTSRTPLFTVLALLLGFTFVSVAFWAWFRFRSRPSEPLAPASTD